MSKAVKRQYNSTRRQEQANETRLRMVRAAHDLFVEKGYGRTTIAQIAERAGVAVETVYAAFRNKATLLRQAWFVTFRGDEANVPLYDRAEMQAILAEQDLPTRIGKHAVFVTASNRRMAPLYHALQGAAATEQAAAVLLDEYRGRRWTLPPSTRRRPPRPASSRSPRRTAATSCLPPWTVRSGTGWSSNAAGLTSATRGGWPASLGIPAGQAPPHRNEVTRRGLRICSYPPPLVLP